MLLREIPSLHSDYQNDTNFSTFIRKKVRVLENADRAIPFMSFVISCHSASGETRITKKTMSLQSVFGVTIPHQKSFLKREGKWSAKKRRVRIHVFGL